MSEVVDAAIGLPSRRTVIGAAAWSVPVIAVMTATPAFAASSPPEAILVWNNLAVWQFRGRLVGGNFGLRIQHPGLTAVASVALYLKDAGGKVVNTMNLGPYILATNKNGVEFTFPDALPVGKTYSVNGIATGTLSSWTEGKTTRTGSWRLEAVPMQGGSSTIGDW